MYNKIKNFFTSHLDFKIYGPTWITILVAIAVIPCYLFLPEKYAYENSLIENLQLLVLLSGFVIAVRAKVDKKFFYLLAMVIVILALREVNCGRTIFFPVPGEVNSFYSWKEIKYGWLAHPLYGLYMAYVVFYFLKNKIFITLWQKMTNIKFPVINILLLLLGMGVGLYAEKALNNMVLEEMTELLFYVSFVGIIFLYAFNKHFQQDNKTDCKE